MLLALTIQTQARVVINEIMYHAPTGQDSDTFLELLNAGDETVSLKNWRFIDGVFFVFPDMRLEAGGRLVVAASPEHFQARFPAVAPVLGPWQGRLSNRSERVRLIDEMGATVDQVKYADEGEWAWRFLEPPDRNHRGWMWSDLHDGGGRSLELINPTVSNDHGQNWQASAADWGTPGQVNSVFSTQTAPLILDVRLAPLTPRSSDTVTVTARLLDDAPDGLSLDLFFRLDQPHDAPPLPFTRIAMADDGAHGDGVAGDGVFGAHIPPHPDGAVVELYLSASDSDGNTRSWPAPCEVDGEWRQAANVLIQVDDAFAPETWTPGDPPLYRIIMTDAQREELAYIGSNYTDSLSNAHMNATFISLDAGGVRARYNTLVRNRGKGSRRKPPNNYKVRFQHDRPWSGVSALWINSKYPHSQFLGMRLFQEAGLTASRSQLIGVRVNGEDLSEAGARMYGQYVHHEAYDQDFADSHFRDDSDGNLYRCASDSRKTDLLYRGDQPGAYISAGYSKKTNESLDDWSDLMALTYALTYAPDDAYLEQVSEVVDIDQWVRWFALQNLIGNNETNLGNGVGDDFAMYRGVRDGRFVLLPHDLDTCFGMGDQPNNGLDSIFRATALPVVERFLTHPEIVGRYYDALDALIRGPFSPDNMAALAEEALADVSAADAAATIGNFVATRIASVRSQMPDTFSIRVNLPIQNGYYYSTTATTPVFGQAPVVGTKSVRVNGQPADWSPIDGAWSLGATSGSIETTPLIPKGDVWKYQDDGAGLGDQWWASDYDDTDWPSGPARLGYGGDGEVTTLGYGSSSSNKRMAAYFRNRFFLDADAAFSTLTVQLLRDDGAVVYLNDTEVIRSNMPLDTVITSMTAALSVVGGLDEQTFFEYTLPGALLRPGWNTLAAETHQINPRSSDLGFDLALLALDAESVVSTGGVTLRPGVNRITVETFSGPDGAGDRLERDTIEVWYDAGPATPLEDTVNQHTVLDAASGPYVVSGDLVVPVGVTLTIAPGATLFFQPGARLIVQGRLLAEGTPYLPIRLDGAPESGARWNGIVFDNAMEPENRLAHVDMRLGDGASQWITVNSSALVIEHMTWADTSRTVLEVDRSSLIIRHCVFPNSFGAEVIHGSYIAEGGVFILRNNVFHPTTGYCDVIDFSGCKRPDPILEVYDNVFLGGSDDGLDLDGTDAHIEGNVFMHFRKNNTSSSTANAIATGRRLGWNSELVVARNLFFDNDHDVLLKEDCHMIAQNNTFAGWRFASINFGEPERSVTYGRGADLEGNIFWGAPTPFLNHAPDDAVHPVITAIQNILPAEYHALGAGNLDADPRFLDAEGEDFRLAPDSPARGAGPNGLDMGAHVPAGVTFANLPAARSRQNQAIIPVYGPGLTHYRWRLNDGPWGEILSIEAAAISLIGLPPGEYRVSALGRNSAGRWQEESEATVSPTWTVLGAPSAIVVSEVMVNPPGDSVYEFIELRNSSPVNTADLSGMAFTEGIYFAFPEGVLLEPEGYLVVCRAANPTAMDDFRAFYGLDAAVPVLGPYSGKLDNAGETVTLSDSVSGVAIVSFTYGSDRGWPLAAAGAGHSLIPLLQTDQSNGSLDYGRHWRASHYIIGSPGAPDPTAGPGLGLSEVLVRTAPDGAADPTGPWIELVHTGAGSISLAGFYLSDDAGALRKWPLAEQIIHPGQFLTLGAGGGLALSPGGAPFALDGQGGNLLLSRFPADAGEGEGPRVVDSVRFMAQEQGLSLGRYPDGGDWRETMTPTRGGANRAPLARPIITEIMYNPRPQVEDPALETLLEYIEIHNPTGQTVRLESAAGPWRIANGVTFVLPPGQSLAPGETALIVHFDPADGVSRQTFLEHYGLSAGDVTLAGPYTGRLSNRGERVALEKPAAPDAPGGETAWVLMDEVIYFDRSPWPHSADGDGAALHRRGVALSGNDPENWQAAPPSPGQAQGYATRSFSGWIVF